MTNLYIWGRQSWPAVRYQVYCEIIAEGQRKTVCKTKHTDRYAWPSLYALGNWVQRMKCRCSHMFITQIYEGHICKFHAHAQKSVFISAPSWLM
jgi:hypothetical protein